MTTPGPPVSLSVATGIQLADGTWYAIQNASLRAVIDPSFSDPVSGSLITPADTWVQYSGIQATWVSGVLTASGTTPAAFACPMRSVAAVQLAAPVA